MVAEEVDVSGRVGEPVDDLGEYPAKMSESATDPPGDLVRTCLFGPLRQGLGRGSGV